jgi:hypothetical protein
MRVLVAAAGSIRQWGAPVNALLRRMPGKHFYCQDEIELVMYQSDILEMTRAGRVRAVLIKRQPFFTR